MCVGKEHGMEESERRQIGRGGGTGMRGKGRGVKRGGVWEREVKVKGKKRKVVSVFTVIPLSSNISVQG